MRRSYGLHVDIKHAETSTDKILGEENEKHEK
jgi:hypothetical protein